jgi:anti-sigma-K factor RskA
MTEPSHRPYDGLAGLYAIGGLNRVDRDRFEQHLETCAACVVAVTQLLPVARGLSQAAPTEEPPARLRLRIVGTEPDSAPPPRPAARIPVSGSRVAPVYRVAAVLCLIAAGAVGWYAAQQVNGSRQLRQRLDTAALRIQAADLDASSSRRVARELRAHADVLAAPDVTTIRLQGQQRAAPDLAGSLFLSETRGAVIAASNVPPLPPGQVYQVWFIVPLDPIAVGIAPVDGAGRILATVDPPADAGLPPLAVAVTLEPEGGAAEPSDDLFLLGRTDR